MGITQKGKSNILKCYHSNSIDPLSFHHHPNGCCRKSFDSASERALQSPAGSKIILRHKLIFPSIKRKRGKFLFSCSLVFLHYHTIFKSVLGTSLMSNIILTLEASLQFRSIPFFRFCILFSKNLNLNGRMNWWVWLCSTYNMCFDL